MAWKSFWISSKEVWVSPEGNIPFLPIHTNRNVIVCNQGKSRWELKKIHREKMPWDVIRIIDRDLGDMSTNYWGIQVHETFSQCLGKFVCGSHFEFSTRRASIHPLALLWVQGGWSPLTSLGKVSICPQENIAGRPVRVTFLTTIQPKPRKASLMQNSCKTAFKQHIRS